MSAIALVVALYTPINDYLTRTTGMIDQPSNGFRIVADELVVTGSVGHPPPGDQDIWLVVRRPTGTYYPQGPVILARDETWGSTIFVEGDTGRYSVLLYLTSSVATSEFRTYLRANQKNADPPGMPTIPDGATLLDDVDVDKIY